MGHRESAEEALGAPWRTPDGEPYDWQSMLTHALLAVCERMEALAVVIASRDEEFEEDEDEE